MKSTKASRAKIRRMLVAQNKSTTRNDHVRSVQKKRKACDESLGDWELLAAVGYYEMEELSKDGGN